MKKILLGSLLGALIGAGTTYAVLKKNELVDKFNEFKDKISSKAEEIKDEQPAQEPEVNK